MINAKWSLRPMSGVEERGREIAFMTIKASSKKKKREGKGEFTLEATRVRTQVNCKLSQA